MSNSPCLDPRQAGLCTHTLMQHLLCGPACLCPGRFSTVKLRGRRAGCVACGDSPQITRDSLASYDYVSFTGGAATPGVCARRFVAHSCQYRQDSMCVRGSMLSSNAGDIWGVIAVEMPATACPTNTAKVCHPLLPSVSTGQPPTDGPPVPLQLIPPEHRLLPHQLKVGQSLVLPHAPIVVTVHHLRGTSGHCRRNQHTD